MFDIWHKIIEESEAAIPANPSALSALEWCEIGEKYPHQGELCRDGQGGIGAEIVFQRHVG